MISIFRCELRLGLLRGLCATFGCFVQSLAIDQILLLSDREAGASAHLVNDCYQHERSRPSGLGLDLPYGRDALNHVADAERLVEFYPPASKHAARVGQWRQ